MTPSLTCGPEICMSVTPCQSNASEDPFSEDLTQLAHFLILFKIPIPPLHATTTTRHRPLPTTTRTLSLPHLACSHHSYGRLLCVRGKRLPPEVAATGDFCRHWHRRHRTLGCHHCGARGGRRCGETRSAARRHYRS
jgi:hypothetical protein